MILALSGAHRVGKTTMARAAAKMHGFNLLEMDTASVIRELGVDVKTLGNDFDQRLDVQVMLTMHYVKEFGRIASDGGNWIVDRSPIDLIGYLFADIGQNSITADLQKEKVQKLVVATAAILSNVDHGILIPPNPEFLRDEDGKSRACSFYIAHVDAMIESFSRLWYEKGIYGYSKLNPDTTVQERAESVGEIIAHILMRDSEANNSTAIVSGPTSIN